MPVADLVPKGDPSVGTFIAIMALGFLIGTAGHIRRSNAMVIVGIVLIFAATVVLPLIVFRGGE